MGKKWAKVGNCIGVVVTYALFFIGTPPPADSLFTRANQYQAQLTGPDNRTKTGSGRGCSLPTDFGRALKSPAVPNEKQGLG